MAGYRIRRKTTASNFVAVSGTLQLPWAYSNSIDDWVNDTGIFPEFFYNFNNTAGTVNMDLGLVFRGNNGWHIFAYGANVNNSANWYEAAISLSPGQIVTVAVYTEDYMVKLKINDYIYIIPTTNGTAAAIRSGCMITREANLVPQKSSGLTECWLLQTDAYYIGAVWSQTTLTTTSGTYVKMSAANTSSDYALDSGDPTRFDANCITHTASTSNGYVADNCTIDFRNRVYCQ
ncbi:MAG: hypothetical protein IKU39_03135 [Lachnospiraceae bacterium]|nr:hypothetical protein [Lachnospiraceae bacterium]